MACVDRFAPILEAVRAIPPGEVRTYGDVSPGAPQLAGRALGSICESVAPCALCSTAI